MGSHTSPSNKTTQKGAELPEIPPLVAWQQPPDKVSSLSGSSWLPARWDPASADGCPR